MEMNRWLIKDDSANRLGLWIPRRLELSQEVEVDILLACQEAHERYHTEIFGLACVQRQDADSCFVPPEVVIPHQICTKARTGNLFRIAFQELIQEHGNISEYLWWHSHRDDSVGFSHIDVETIERRLHSMLFDLNIDYYKQGMEIPNETMVGPFFSIVANIYGEMAARWDFLLRCGDDYYPIVGHNIPLERSFNLLPKVTQNRILRLRIPRIRRLVRQHVTLGPTRITE